MEERVNVCVESTDLCQPQRSVQPELGLKLLPIFEFSLCQRKILKIWDFAIGLKISCSVVNLLPDNKILEWSKLKQIADDTLKWI